ncbi:uncharacterized protein ACB057_000900 [Neosynchiropus ocellatus]
MVNSTLTYFVLSAYGSVGSLRHLYCGMVLALYMWVLAVNTLLITLIYMDRNLHEPMYLLLCSLFINQLFGSTALLPFLALQILSDLHTVPAHLCFLQVISLYAYGNVEFCTLALISYDRHLAICCPLQYNTRMSPRKVLVLVTLTWIYSLLRPMITVLLTVRLPLCGNVLDSLYCQNHLISKLTCSDSQVNNIYGLIGLVPSIALPLLAILFSYLKILRICFAASRQTRQKALSTCMPHLVSLINFSFGCCFALVRSRFDMRRSPRELRVAMSLYFLLIQPLLNPVMYGLQLSRIRGALKRLMPGGKTRPRSPAVAAEGISAAAASPLGAATRPALPAVMENNSQIVFALHGLNSTPFQRQVCFSFALAAYVLTIFVNAILVITVCVEAALHQPLYIFLSSLCLNGLLGASSFYPKLLHDLLADAHVVSYVGCLLQMTFTYSYIFCEFCTLTVMAYDRYVAICKPLQYHSVMTTQKVAQLLLFCWTFPVLEALVGMVLTARLPLCGRHIHKLFCTNWEVVKLSCTDTTVNNIYGFVLTVSHAAQAVLILLSYAHLVRASLRSCSDRRKVAQTCLPHLVALLVFTTMLVFDSMFSRYGGKLQALQNMLAAEYLVVPPLINPIIYGINLQQIRTRVLHSFNFGACRGGLA